MVQDALDKIRAQRKLTTVTVAHRLTTIVNSDKIVVLADGAIQESGTHTELHQLGGIYTSLCEGQGLTADATSKANVLGAIEEGTEKMDIKEEVAKVAVAEQLDVEKGEVREDSGQLEEVEDIDIAGVASRLQKYNRPEIVYTIVGYAGGIVVGCLPAAEAILFGFITGNFYKYNTGQELLDVNLPICLWFIFLSACSFIGNICMGIGKSNSLNKCPYLFCQMLISFLSPLF